MKPRAIGFYWTLPVPWAGFMRIDEKDVDEAARQSRTIALQREVIRRWARENRINLVHEEAFVELSPDRGSPQMSDSLQPLIDRALREEARILFVDFGRAIGWRSHHYLRELVDENAMLFQDVALSYAETELFTSHFSSWRARQRDWIGTKYQRAALARQRGHELRGEGLGYGAVAERLNVEGIASLTGKPWTGDNLRKLLRDA